MATSNDITPATPTAAEIAAKAAAEARYDAVFGIDPNDGYVNDEDGCYGDEGDGYGGY